MDNAAQHRLEAELDSIREQGLFKTERVITTPQSSAIRTTDGREVLNFCANNYLGLADHPDIVHAAQKAVHQYGFGMASVRFICGTQEVHKELEARLSAFLGQEDTILYSSCFDANGGVFETLLGPEDAVISDALNHASIIDGIRLSKARRFRYANRDLADLERLLAEPGTNALQAWLHRVSGALGMAEATALSRVGLSLERELEKGRQPHLDTAIRRFADDARQVLVALHEQVPPIGYSPDA